MKICILTFFYFVWSKPAFGNVIGLITPIEDFICGGVGTVVEIVVEGCEIPPPCIIEPGQEINIGVGYILSERSPLAKFRMSAEMSGLIVPIVDAELGPLNANQVYRSTQTVRLGTTLPSGTRIDAKTEVYDAATDRIEICVRVPMVIR